MTTSKTALVTGADGFIGSHLTELLHSRGYNVRALAQYNSFNDWGWLEDVACLEDIDVRSGDIRDPYFCNELTRDVDFVFHLAALIAIPYSYVAPQSYVDTNVSGTLNMCQSALQNNVTKILHTSTSEVYGTARYVPIDESHPLQPQSPYSASKIGADAVAMSYFNSFDLPLTIVRPFNTYGPRQSARAVIPSIISQLASKPERIDLGDLSPTRDFNYVEDTCLGFLALAECESSTGLAVNVGSGGEVSIADVVHLTKRLMGSNAEVVVDDNRLRPEKSEVFRLVCDNSQLRQLTDFSPSHSFEEGLAKTIEWFSKPENLAKYKTDIYNV